MGIALERHGNVRSVSEVRLREFASGAKVSDERVMTASPRICLELLCGSEHF